MSLAAALAGGGMRPASFLPAIKCSNCGDEIEIAAMGDHICGRAAPSPKSQPASLYNPFTLRQLNANGHNPVHAPSPLQFSQQPPRSQPSQTRVRAPAITSHSTPAPKPSRTALPRIDPGVANTPFLAPRPPRSESPISPAISTKSGSSNGSRPPALRSLSIPAPRVFDPRPPSPELSANLDCAFPPFPTSSGSGSRPGTSNGRGTPTGSERAPSRGGGSRQEGKLGGDRELSNLASKSLKATDNVMQRMHTLKSGPFDGTRRKPSDEGRSRQSSQPLDRRRPSLPNMNQEPLPIPAEPVPRPSTSHSNESQVPLPITLSNKFSRAGAPTALKKEPPSRPDRPTEEVLSPQFLDRLTAEPVTAMPSTFSPSQPPLPITSSDRSRTFPLRRDNGDKVPPSHVLSMAPSEPEMRGRERRSPSTSQSRSEHSQTPQAQSRQRSQSRSGTRVDYRILDVPPVPRPVQQHRQDSMYTQSESGSSTHSSGHSSNANSSGASPAGSAASSVDALSPLTYEPSAYGNDQDLRIAGLNVRRQNQQKPGMGAEQPKHKSPPRSCAWPNPPRQSAPTEEPQPPLPVTPGPPLQSAINPALQPMQLGHGTYQGWQPKVVPQQRPQLNATQTTQDPKGWRPTVAVPKPSAGEYDPFRAVSPQPDTRARSKSNAVPQYQAYKPATQMKAYSPQCVPAPPPISREGPQNQPLVGHSTAAKATCRGCWMLIEGKSVKAADGRLTGRWHKACFVCRACEQPFTTADFYVINNHPYCEQHYHEQNGSLCHGCHRGIEGPYLETTSSSAMGSVDKKFHPRCFTCHDCREVLAEDYFEITGKVYCERHALAAMRGQARMAGPGLGAPDKRGMMAERRTTRLMMM